MGLVDLRFQEARLVVRPFGECALVLLCEKSVNLQLVLHVRDGGGEEVRAPCGAPSAFRGTCPGPGSSPAGWPRPGSARAPGHGGAGGREGGLTGRAAAWAPPLGGGFGGDGGAPRPRRPRLPLRAGDAGEEKPAPAAETMLRVTGTDGLGGALVPALAQAYLAAQHATEVRVDGSHKGEIGVEGLLDGAKRSVVITSRGVAQGFEALLRRRRRDRRLAAESEERAWLSPLGPMTSQAGTEHLLAVDAPGLRSSTGELGGAAECGSSPACSGRGEPTGRSWASPADDRRSGGTPWACRARARWRPRGSTSRARRQLPASPKVFRDAVMGEKPFFGERDEARPPSRRWPTGWRVMREVWDSCPCPSGRARVGRGRPGTGGDPPDRLHGGDRGVLPEPPALPLHGEASREPAVGRPVRAGQDGQGVERSGLWSWR